MACLLTLGQESQFSQYFASSTITNAAFVGVIPNLSFNTNYRSNWTKNSDEFSEIMQGTFTYPFKRVTSRDFQIGGAGLTFFRERRGFGGLYTTQKVLFTGAYRMRLSQIYHQYIVFGLQGGFVQTALDGNQLRWGSQFNRFLASAGGFDGSRTGENLSQNKHGYPVFNFGIVYSTFDNENTYIRDRSVVLGLGIDNLNRPDVSLDGSVASHKPRTYRLFGTAKFPMNPRVFIHPSAYILYQGGSDQVNLGTYFSTLASSVRSQTAVVLQVGYWYRTHDGHIIMAGTQVDNIRLGISYDTNKQAFGAEDLGKDTPSFEISLTYNLDLANPLRSVPSPIL